jgi:hypothetical protein
MKSKFFALMLALLVVPMLLTACGGGVSEEDAEKALKAAFAGDRDEANKYFCDDDQMSQETADSMKASVDAGMEVKSVECKKDGDKMNCDITVAIAGQETKQPVSLDIDGDKLCGGNLGGN